MKLCWQAPDGRAETVEYCYEILLGKAPNAAAWQEFLRAVRRFVGLGRRISLTLRLDQATLHYYLSTPKPLPLNLGVAGFLLSPAKPLAPVEAQATAGLYPNLAAESFAELRRRLKRRDQELEEVELELGISTQTLARAHIIYSGPEHRLRRQRLLFCNPEQLLAVDFDREPDLCYKKIPKYLKIDKNLELLKPSATHGLFAVATFPYAEQDAWLELGSYDFAKHSLVIGSSGAGKSKFLALLIQQIAEQAPDQYKIIVIDPHDRLKDDLVGIQPQSVINFRTIQSSIDLFCNHSTDVNASVELMLSLFRTLIADGYNGRMERVLRFSTYLLLAKGDFSFLSLRRLLTDLEYRNQLVTDMARKLPASVAHFFLTDFHELKTQSYDEAIAPIIAFIDEMQMVPVFSEPTPLPGLEELMQKNFLSIFSLNSLSLGNTVTRTIAGLLFQQIFLLAQTKRISQKIILVVDEAAVIENPILARFLSELRKYQTSLILASQYFEQISPALGAAILANVSNYYLFRTSKVDAKLFIENLEIKTQGGDDAEKFLTGLKTQECLVRVAKGEKLYPIMRARVADFVPVEPSAPAAAEALSAEPAKNALLEQPFEFPTQTADDLLEKPFEFKAPAAPSPSDERSSNAEPAQKTAGSDKFEIGGDVKFDDLMQSVRTGQQKGNA